MRTSLSSLIRTILREGETPSSEKTGGVRLLLSSNVHPDILRINSENQVLVPDLAIVRGKSHAIKQISSGMLQKHREAYAALKGAGMSDYEIGVAKAAHTTPIPVFYHYDSDFNTKGEKYGVPPEILKAIALRESTGKEGSGASGFTSGKVMHLTKDLLDQMKKEYPNLFGIYKESDLKGPKSSITMATKRLHVLMHIKKMSVRDAINAYGPGRDDYANEVEAFRKLVVAIQVEPVGKAKP